MFIFALMKKLFLAISLLALTSCKNSLVKRYGQTETYTLPQGKKLVNVTWKDDALWILTKPMKPNDTSETYSYKETSKYGIIEGEYIIQEVK